MNARSSLTQEPHTTVTRSTWKPALEVWSFHNWLRSGIYCTPVFAITAPVGGCVETIRARAGIRRQSGDRSGVLIATPGESLIVEQLRGRQPRLGERTIAAISIPSDYLEGILGRELSGGLVYARGRGSLGDRFAATVAKLESAELPRTQREEAVLELLDETARASGASDVRDVRPCSTRVARAREYLHAHFAEAFSLDQTADAVGLSKWYLIKMFREQFGVTPGQYTRALRVQHALTQIRAGSAPAEAAACAGYADTAHMGREVRAVLGLTPARYGRFVHRLS